MSTAASKALTPQQVMERRERGAALVKQSPAEWITARFAVLSTFNVDLLRPFLAESMSHHQVRAESWFGGFGQIAQHVFNEASELYAFDPHYVWIVAAAEDLLPALFDRPGRFSADEALQLADRAASDLRAWADAVLQRRPGATCIISVIGPADVPSPHVLSPASPDRAHAALDAFTAALSRLPEHSDRILVLDWDWYTRGIGSAHCRDARLWYLARMRLNHTGLATLCDQLSVAFRAWTRAAKKVAVLDLDNTLWSGIIGEAGLTGIQLGGEGIGLAFQDVQREMLRLHDTGVLLAVCSKNNPEDAWEAIDNHHGMILRREHFAATAINWTDKATNIRQIAEQLNLGLDSLVFFDDNPAERAWIRQELPSVEVPELPADPVQWPGFLRAGSWFDRISVTSEDRQRAQSYQAEASRKTLLASAASVESFLDSLEQVVRIEPLDRTTLARAAQLCQKTNQFNLTTRRYTVADLEQMIADPGVEVFTISVADRFGDSGITGVTVLRIAGEEAEIDTFLLSCRVLGRRVEDQALTHLKERAAVRGARLLRAMYIPTQKNRQTERFYPDRGFAPEGNNVWSFAVASVQQEEMNAHA